MSTVECLHRWTVESRHRTSEGTVVYHRCHCGRHRVTRETPVQEAVGISSPTYRP